MADENQDGLDWAASPATGRLAKHLKALKKKAYDDWKAASEKSTDPRVARAFAQFEAHTATIAALQTLAGSPGEEE